MNHPLGILVLGLDHNDTGDLFRLLAFALGNPAQGDGVTGVPQIELLEGDRGLRALAGFEGGEGVEGGGAELEGGE